MDWIVDMTARFIADLRLAYAWKWSFFGLFALVFAVSTVTLWQLDLLPNRNVVEAVTTSFAEVTDGAGKLPASPRIATSTSSPMKSVAEEPLKVEIPSLKLSATIANPTTTDVKTLDDLLLKGVVRYPTSAKLGEQGNVVLFGHSSYLPIVNNQAYKSFNGIQKLKQGDAVIVYSSGTAYTYAVRTVAKESANDAVIQLSVTGSVLTLATCDSFGAKSDRFVVTADLVESHLIGA